MLNRFKRFFDKDDYNYSEGIVDPYEFHKTFYKFLVSFKVADIDNKNSGMWSILMAFTFTIQVTATILSFTSLYHGFDCFDIPFMTEAGSYFIILLHQIIIMSCTKLNLPQYHNLLMAMKKDFLYICVEGVKYREKYFVNQITTWKICIIICIFMACISNAMVAFSILSLVYFLFSHESEYEGSRPQLFPLWLPNVDIGKTPYYEIGLVFSDTCVLMCAYTHVFMMQTQVVWIRHVASKADIIIWKIQDLLDGINLEKIRQHEFSNLIDTRMRSIVIHHQDMLSLLYEYTIVYKKIILYEQKCCWPLICLTAYSTAEKLDKGEFQVILLLLCIGAIVIFFIPCYMCTLLANKVSAIGDTCWKIPFWTTGPVICPYMVLIMQRARRPLPIQSPGFESISLETFSKKMSSAYSFFNMLRQVNLK